MYTLRRISKDNYQNNAYLGTEYSLIMEESSPLEYVKAYENFFSEKPNDKNCYGFVISYGGESLYPLYKNSKNQILKDGGRVFSDLTII